MIVCKWFEKTSNCLFEVFFGTNDDGALGISIKLKLKSIFKVGGRRMSRSW